VAQRRGDAEVDRFEAEGLEFHRGLRKSFLDIAQEEPARCAVVDAAQPPDAVADAIWRAVETRLPVPAAPEEASS
jgi:dTMP kinase